MSPNFNHFYSWTIQQIFNEGSFSLINLNLFF